MEEDLFPRQITNYEKRDDGDFKEVQNQLKENTEVTVQKNIMNEGEFYCSLTNSRE